MNRIPSIHIPVVREHVYTAHFTAQFKLLGKESCQRQGLQCMRKLSYQINPSIYEEACT